MARSFSGNPWVLGYDPFNEPFSTSLIRFGDAHFDAQLECFYTGTANVGSPSHGAPALRCPKHDPAEGVVPTILADDHDHLIFDEPDNYASRGYPTYIGPMDLPDLVFNVHIYCGARSPVTGNPTNVAVCADQDARSLLRRGEDRPSMASARQPGGPAWLVSEFGATASPALLTSITAALDDEKVGWAFWAWKYYDDPTGSAAESLVMADGRLRSTALVLGPHLPAGSHRRADLVRLLPDDRCLPYDLRAQPPRPGADGDLRAHRAPLQRRLLRPCHRRPGDVGPGERPTRGAERQGRPSRHRGRDAGALCHDPGLGWRHVPQHHDPPRARARGHPRGDRGGARQYVRKVSSIQSTSPQTEEAFDRAVTQVTEATTALLATLPPRRGPPRRPSRRCAGSLPRPPLPLDDPLTGYMPIRKYNLYGVHI